MRAIIRRRLLECLGLLAVLAAAGFSTSGCTSADGPKLSGSQEPSPSAVNRERSLSTSPDNRGDPLTINVEMSDSAIQPPSLFIPMGKSVQLVLRNRGLTEHHFRVVGLVPRDLLWIAPAEEGGGSVIDHEAHHHDTAVGAYRMPSPAGIRPTGTEVHAYARGGGSGIDVVLFTSTNRGTFPVQCPLHPEMVGQVTVF